ncbi:LuxR C-terminal-related transcriptional regulator [Nesterenkonia xinjiangensis]
MLDSTLPQDHTQAMVLLDTTPTTAVPRGRHRDSAARRVREVCCDAPSTAELIKGLRTPLHDALGMSGMLLSATDPDTLVLSTAAVIENLPEAMCAPWMHNEFLEADFNKFADLHRSAAKATTLHRVTQGNPELSPRHRDLNGPMGFGAELRTTFSRRGVCWGVGNFLRERREEDFAPEDLAWLERLRPVIAAGLQRCTVLDLRSDEVDCAPGVVTLDPLGQVVSMNDSAPQLLAELWAHAIDAGPQTKLPGEAYMIATLTRARARGHPRAGPPVTRLHGRSGRWLTIRGDHTLTPDGRLSCIVLVIEPSRPTEVMPLVVAAYGLTAREQEVLAELSNGRPTGEIATRLFISEHTVRDHIRSVLSKTGTASRGELLSLLFHHHAAPATQFTHA